MTIPDEDGMTTEAERGSVTISLAQWQALQSFALQLLTNDDGEVESISDALDLGAEFDLITPEGELAAWLTAKPLQSSGACDCPEPGCQHDEDRLEAAKLRFPNHPFAKEVELTHDCIERHNAMMSVITAIVCAYDYGGTATTICRAVKDNMPEMRRLMGTPGAVVKTAPGKTKFGDEPE